MTVITQESERMDQQRLLAKIPDSQELKRSMPIVWLLSAVLVIAVQLNVVAQDPLEVNVRVAQSATTVNCPTGEHRVAIVKASLADPGSGANASAFGFALLSPKDVKDVKMFARYWFFFPPDKVQSNRDDDSGKLGKTLVPGQISKGNVDTFFSNCSVDKENITRLLIQANDQTSIHEAAGTLSASGLQFKAATESKQKLANALTDSEESNVAFSEAIRAALQQQAADNVSSTQQPGPATTEPVNTGDQSEAIQKSLKQLDGKIDAFAYAYRLLLAALIFAAVIAVALVILAAILFYVKPTLRPRVLLDQEVKNEIRQRIADEMQDFSKLNAQAGHGAGDNMDVNALREFISNQFGKKFLEPDVQKGLNKLTAELNKQLLPLAGNNSNEASPILGQLSSAREQVETMWEAYSEKPCPSGALRTLQKDWTRLQSVFLPFRQTDFKDVLNYARGSVTLFQLLTEKFKNETSNPEVLKKETEFLFSGLQEIYNESTSPERRFSLSPQGQLIGLRETLRDHKDRTQSVITTIKAVLPDVSGPSDMMAAALVEKFNSNTELVASAEKLKAANEELTGKVATLKTQVQESTQLAGALSQYVHLSTNVELDSSQIQSILQRFNAGDQTQRQLRLRLSAAIEALDQAVASVSNAGRQDALDALKISEFKDHLLELLANIENFTGEALWKNCLSAGFVGKWAHQLLRAELVARTYFAENESLALLLPPLSEACTAIRATIREFKVRVPFLTLLSDPPACARVRYDGDEKLSNLPEYQEKVDAKWEQRKPGEDPKFIVDVELFPWESDSNGNPGEMVAISGSRWNKGPLNA